MADKKIGKVVHFYDKIGVAIVDLEDKLMIGDRVKFVRDGAELFQQDVLSMQIEHNKIESAKKDDSIGIKTDQPIKTGVEVFLIE